MELLLVLVDARGILNVSAVDKSTGKENKILPSLTIKVIQARKTLSAWFMKLRSMELKMRSSRTRCLPRCLQSYVF